ncbi:hypothetical protein CR513_04649, partial [Mucuna pruriens]
MFNIIVLHLDRLDLDLEMSRMDIKFEDEIFGLLLLNFLLESWETFKENKGKKGKSKDKDHDDEGHRVITATSDFGVLKIGNDGMTKVISIGDVCLQSNMRVQLWLKGVKHALDFHFNLISMHMLDGGGYDNYFGYGKWKLTKGRHNGSVINDEMRRKAQGSSSRSKENKGKKGKSKEKDHDDDGDHVTTTTSNDLVILRDFELVNLVSDESMWIIDSGATLHMGNDGVTKVIGVGNVCLHTNMGVQLWLKGVKHALDVRFNLIFVHMLDGGGYDNHFGYGKWKLTKGRHNGSVLNEDMRGKAQGFSSRSEEKENKGKKCKSKEKDHDDDDDHVTTAIGDDFVILRDFVSINLVSDKSMWIIDSSATLHVTPRKELFTSYTLGDFGVLKMGNYGVTKFGKYAKYDHLQVFGCKAFVHVLEDKRSKLDMKIRQCIFVGYGQDEYDYRLYDPVEKKLVRSCDVQFMEDQTIEDINKVKKTTPKKDNSLFAIDLVQMLIHDLDTTKNNVQNGEQHNYVSDQQLGDGFDVPPYDNLIILLFPSNEAEKTNMSRVPYASVRALECYEIDFEVSSRSKHIHVRYHWIRDALDAKLLELVKFHTNDNGDDMITKALPRGKFKTCCEIVGLAITST